MTDMKIRRLQPVVLPPREFQTSIIFPKILCTTALHQLQPFRRSKKLESKIATDSGNWGIGHLLCKDELLRASLSLSHACLVLITTGFPTHFNHEPPEETDGLPGAIALAAFLQALEKVVSTIADQRALSLYGELVEEAVEQDSTIWW